jgi:two-component system, OmpR family, response regulator
MAHILIVDDDNDFLSLVAANLVAQDHRLVTAKSGLDALGLLAGQAPEQSFDLIMLDIELPAIKGTDVCRSYRDASGQSPVLMVGVSDDDELKASVLDAGADDYMTKPLDLAELSSRIRALLRRPPTFAGLNLKAGDLTIDARSLSVRRGDMPIVLLPKEYALLEFFMRHPNQVFSTDLLINRLWPADESISPETIRTHIKNLRKKLTMSPACKTGSKLATVHGIGYKFEP